MQTRHPRWAKGGLLVLLRHGQSSLNEAGRFSGWADCPLTGEGVRQAHEAGRELRDAGIGFDACFTSVLSRAVETASIVLGELGLAEIPVTRTWRLNERHYGALEGLLKREVAAQCGAAQVEAWRNGADATPPPLSGNDPRHPRHSEIYRDVAPELLPTTENLRDAFSRVIHIYEEGIRPLVESGKRILVVSHGNPIRALVAHLDGLPPGEIPLIEIQNAKPIVYR
jgi:2,3-bisphosphoglycerate-dependent phosphoglycerate mutase